MRHLIIVVPGLKSDPATWNPLREKLLKEPKLTGSVWCLWNHQAQQRPWKRANTLARELLAFITQEWNRCGRPEQIMLIGHSMGGILVRQAYLLASGTLPEHTNREKWHNKVRHIILFAGTNRGFSPERHLTTMWLARIARYTGTNRYLPYSDFLSGSDFITNLRISWLRYFPTLGENEPVIVQLLGNDDDIVTLNDSIDVEQFPRAYQFTVVKAQHADLYRLDMLQPIDAKARYELIRDAILHPQELQEQPGQPEQRNRDLATDKIVVFILHGIRADNLGWVDTIEQKIKQRAKAQGIDVEVISKGYEYFSAFQFAVPLLRRLNIRWFQDEYGDALVRHPKARFHFIGHSNGTYILGKSLEVIPGMKFERVALVGSVLPPKYPWNKGFEAFQSHMANRDWPVGWLCSFLRGLFADVGTGGFVGFAGVNASQLKGYYDGGHSAPLGDANLDTFVDYVLERKDTAFTRVPKAAPPSYIFRFVSRALFVLGRTLVFGVPLVLAWLMWIQAWLPLSLITVVVAIIATILYLL